MRNTTFSNRTNEGDAIKFRQSQIQKLAHTAELVTNLIFRVDNPRDENCPIIE